MALAYHETAASRHAERGRAGERAAAFAPASGRAVG
jgi:hypothetical protein